MRPSIQRSPWFSFVLVALCLSGCQYAPSHLPAHSTRPTTNPNDDRLGPQTPHLRDFSPGSYVSLGFDCTYDPAEPLLKTDCSVGGWANQEEWYEQNPGRTDHYSWLPDDQLLFLPESALPRAVELLNDKPFLEIRSGIAGRRAYLARAVYPDLPGGSGCKHHYRARMDSASDVTVVNPTLGWKHQCPVFVRRSAVIVLVDHEITEAHATTAILVQ